MAGHHKARGWGVLTSAMSLKEEKNLSFLLKEDNLQLKDVLWMPFFLGFSEFNKKKKKGIHCKYTK